MRGLVFSCLLTAGHAAGAPPTTCKDMKDNYGAQQCCGAPTKEVPLQVVPRPLSLTNNRISDPAKNPCKNKNPAWPNKACMQGNVVDAAEQAGGDVTAGFVGDYDSAIKPITNHYYKGAPAEDGGLGPLCPVNVHWHLGAEHRSQGEYDENGVSPQLAGVPNQPLVLDPPRRLANESRQLGGSDVRYGFACHLYDAEDPKFTTPYTWQHCLDMHVGETYEVHWPSSVLGACNTPYQYQSKFYDGVFCRWDDALTPGTPETGLTAQQIASNVGVQSQVFTIVNDEDYYYPNLMRGMIVNDNGDGDFGKDLGIYTGSSTGTSRDASNVCSAYTPITWQVDRKCHLISASTFDKMCADMKQNFDDMSMDLHPHGSRPLVDPALNADNLEGGNHQTR